MYETNRVEEAQSPTRGGDQVDGSEGDRALDFRASCFWPAERASSCYHERVVWSSVSLGPETRLCADGDEETSLIFRY